MALELNVINPITEAIIGAAIDVHRELGPGLLESAYAVCLLHDLHKSGLKVLRRVKVPVYYDGVRLDCGYELDMLVNDLIVVEIKSVSQLGPIHTAQLLTYLKLTDSPAGLLINFNVTMLRRGVRRILNSQSTKARTADTLAETETP